MAYFTRASARGRVRLGLLPVTVDVLEARDSSVRIGTASEIGTTPTGEALWSLDAPGAPTQSRYIIVDGQFVLIDHARDRYQTPAAHDNFPELLAKSTS